MKKIQAVTLSLFLFLGSSAQGQSTGITATPLVTGSLPVAAGASRLGDSGIAATKGTTNNLTITGGGAGQPVSIGTTGEDSVFLNLIPRGYPILIGPKDSSSFLTDFTGVDSGLIIQSDGLTGWEFAMRSAGDTYSGVHNFMRSEGTLSVPTAILDGDVVGNMGFAGHDGTDFRFRAVQRVAVVGSVSANNIPMDFIWYVGGSGLAESMRLKSTGALNLSRSLTASRLVSTNSSGDLTSSITSANFASSISDTQIGTTGAAGGKKVVCIDTTTKILYASSTGTDCSN